MGMPGEIDSKEVQKVIANIIEVSKKMGVPGGQHIIEPDMDLLKQSKGQGAKFIGYSLDIRLFDKALSEFMNGRDE